MRSIRAGKGLGDSLYLQGVVRHLLSKGQSLSVCSNWPEVFKHLPVTVEPFRRNADINAHYTMRKAQSTNQWQDCCIQAGIKEPVAFRLDWPKSPSLIDWIRGPIVCVLLYRLPMDRADGFAADLLPRFEQMQRMIDSLKGRATVVQIGSGKPLKEYTGIDLDLANKTSVSQLLDLSLNADAFLGYCSFLVPLAESLNKPALFLWARKGLASRTPYIRQITPRKILSAPSSAYVFDDDSEPERAVEVLLRTVADRKSDSREVGGAGRVWSGVAG